MADMILILGESEGLDLSLGETEELELYLSGDPGTVVPAYTGDYEVTPSLEEQTLLTNGKRMEDDVTVHQIPVTYTSNEHGGKTVVIG